MSEALLTLITAPKAFTDPHTAIIQRNALRSWKALGDEVKVMVVGKDKGILETCRELGLAHFPDVICNELGTPLINSMLEIARENSRSPFLGIVNADIILFSDLIASLRVITEKFNRFLLIGQRWDVEVSNEMAGGQEYFLDFRKMLPEVGTQHPPMGSDYFIFPHDCFLEIPAFAIGRAGWDNWFIFKSRWEKWPVIDGTRDVLIAHQNHDYRHLPGGQPHYRLPETKQNVDRGGGEHTIFTLFDSQYDLVEGRMSKKRMSLKKLIREIEIFPLVRLHSHVLGRLCYLIMRPKKAYAQIRKLVS